MKSGLKKVLKKEFLFLSLVVIFLSLTLHYPSVQYLLDITPLEKGVEAYQLPSPSKKTLNKDGFNVLIWNIYKGQRLDWRKTFSKLKQEMDILILQEAFVGEKTTKDWQGEQFHFYFAPTFQTSEYKTGVATLSKIPSTRIQSFYSEEKEPVINTAKAILLSLFKIENDSNELAVINIHGLNFVTANALKKQISVLNKILANHQGPIIFAGDFNTWTQEKTDVVQSLLLKKYQLNEIQFEKDHRTKVFSFPLDRLFIKGLKVIDKKTLRLEEASDHNGIFVRLKLN